MTKTNNTKPLSTGARLNIGLLRLSRNWVKIAALLLGIYVSLPFVAPTLMKLGAEAPARVIYGMYTPMCHRFAFRSFFLYGEQAAYPLAAATNGIGAEGYVPFEEYISQTRIIDEMATNTLPQPPFNMNGLPEFSGIPLRDDMTPRDGSDAVTFARLQIAASTFLGNETMGYKVTICERDISIYIAMFFGALIYMVPTVRRRLRPCPLWLYVILGVAPIGIDGFSQLLGYPPFGYWPARETVPLFRVLTGALFGFMNVWLGFPYIQQAMQDTIDNIEAKLYRAGIFV